MLLPLEVPPETVCPQHLQRAEQDEQPHAFTEPSFVHVRVQPCRIEVRRHQLVAQLRGVMRRSLPQETSHVILHRPAPPALEVNETGLPVPVQHDVTRLEIPVLERVPVRVSHQILGHLRKRLFQLHLVKVQSRSLQEAIFKIVQIEENSRPVHGSHRVTPPEIQAFRPDKLDAWQFRYRPPQQFLLFRGVTSAFFAAFRQRVEQAAMPQIGLQIAQTARRNSHNPGHRQPFLPEMPGQINESLVLLP